MVARSNIDYARGVYLIDGQPMTVLECYTYKGHGPFWKGRYRVAGKYLFRYFGRQDPRLGAQALPAYRFPNRRTHTVSGVEYTMQKSQRAARNFIGGEDEYSSYT